MMNVLNYLHSSLLGKPQARRDHQRILAQQPSVSSGVARLESLHRGSADEDDQRPVFIFSAGWRSGSTLLQRLLMSDPDLFIWGESYDHCGLVQSLATTTRAFTQQWPPERYYYDGSPKEALTERWIADLYPTVDHLWNAHRAFFERLFAEPARAMGASRWGLKEVRLGIEHARYLRWLYPKARFLLLYRNPLDAYRSYCGHGRSWYAAWPQGPVFTPVAFGRHWQHLVAGFLEEAESVGGLAVGYEALVAGGKMVDQIESFLEVTLDRDVLARKMGSSESGGEKIWVSRLEKWLLRWAVQPQAGQLGYLW